MPGSVILDAAVGLVFIFLATSLVCTGIVEWWGNKLNTRGEYLLRGLREMLDIPPATPDAPEETVGTRPDGDAPDLLEWIDRRAALQQLSERGAVLRDKLTVAETPIAATEMPANLADLILAHPVVAALHRPIRPGVPGARRPARQKEATAPAEVPPTPSEAVSQTPSKRSRRQRLRHWLRRCRPGRDGMRLASYLSAQTFARALVDLLVPDGMGHTSVRRIEAAVAKLPETVPAREALRAMLRDAGDDVERFRLGVEQWYDEQMGRVSGWYKRWAQVWLFGTGLAVAIAMNINTLGIGQTLYHDEPIRNAVVAQALSGQGCAASRSDACKEALDGLPLPIGWDLDAATGKCRDHAGENCWPHVENWGPYWWERLSHAGLDGVLLTLLGWLLTAAAVSFGAPFWFDALSKLGSLRSAGRRPGENAPYHAKSDN